MRLLLLLCVITWHATSSNAMSTNATWHSPLVAVTESSRTFAKSFFKTIAQNTSGNVICSPLSAYIALSMAAHGARGTTEKELHSALALDGKDAYVEPGMQSLIDHYNNFTRVKLYVANKIFISDKIQPKTAFTEITGNFYRSESETVDFSNNVEATKNINEWCANETHNHIKDLIKPGELESGTALVLVSAIYFNGNWLHEFNAEMTKLRPFHVNNSDIKNVPTMYRSGSYYYGELPTVNAKFVELPYKREQFEHAVSMYIILPKEMDGLAKLEENLNEDVFKQLFHGGTRKVNLYLPKFKIESSIDLKDSLSKLGLSEMFTDRANFTGIVDCPTLKVGKVIQRASIEVNEVGSEATVATAVEFLLGSAFNPTPAPPIELKVDHPFLYVIISHYTRAIVFQGHVKDFNVDDKP